MALTTVLKIHVDGKWRSMGVEEALEIGQREGHCLQCGEDMIVLARYKTGTVPHAEHRPWNIDKKTCNRRSKRSKGYAAKA